MPPPPTRARAALDHSATADTAPGAVIWEARFDGPGDRPRALATLPAGLTLTRASTADFATSSTTTVTAAVNEACLGQPTDYGYSKGLLVRAASGGRAADVLAVATTSVVRSGRLALEITLVVGDDGWAGTDAYLCRCLVFGDVAGVARSDLV